MKLITQWLLTILSLLQLVSCQKEAPPLNNAEIKIRLAQEPDRLNPMLSRQATSTEIERYMFSPLQDYDPQSLQFKPVLIEDPPKITAITEGPFKGGLLYEMRILDSARWEDGEPITASDYLFTMKAAVNPFIANASWRSYLAPIDSIQLDSEDEKKLTVYLSNPYILGEEVICGFSIYPEHVYDSALILQQYGFSSLRQQQAADLAGTPLKAWAEAFNSERFSRDIVTGSGPYRFVNWESGQYIRLERKENYWADQLRDPHPILQGYANEFTFYVIPEIQTALTSLKDRRVDIVSDLSAEQYQSLIEYNREHSHLALFESPILQYYYIAYNNDDPTLSDRRVRMAMSHTLDMDEVISQLFNGLGSRTIGPIHPTKSYYNHDLTPINFDLDESERLLNEAGWSTATSASKDNRVELEILTFQSKLSQDLALIMKENAAKVGVQLTIVPLEFRTLIQRVRNGNYQMACLASNQSPGLNDPYSNWHSDNASQIGNNYCRFRNARCDSITAAIRTTLDENQRNQLYLDFQAVVHKEQPALFLVAPKKVIASPKSFKLKPSALRPGYFANLAKPN